MHSHRRVLTWFKQSGMRIESNLVAGCFCSARECAVNSLLHVLMLLFLCRSMVFVNVTSTC